MEAEAWGRECLSCDWLRESICLLSLVNARMELKMNIMKPTVFRQVLVI